MVERPTYLATLQILSLTAAKVESVGGDEHGMIVDELEASEITPGILLCLRSSRMAEGCRF